MDDSRRTTLVYDGDLFEFGAEEMSWRQHLAVDKRGFVLLTDLKNGRVVLLSPSQSYVRELLSTRNASVVPHRICLDERRGFLFVAVSSRGRYLFPRVLAFKIGQNNDKSTDEDDE